MAWRWLSFTPIRMLPTIRACDRWISCSACRDKGIDKLAITDHHSIRGALELRAIAPDLVIVGEEVMTTQGELLAYFVEEEVPRGLTPRLRLHG